MMLEKFEKILREDSQRSFKSHLGEFKSLAEFCDALKEHKENLYGAYVNQNDNHFANWIEGVFEDHQLANSLRNAKGYEQALGLVEKRVTFAKLSLENEGFFSNFLPPNPLTTDFTPATDKFHRAFDNDSAAGFLSSYLKAKDNFTTNFDASSLGNVIRQKSSASKKVVKKNSAKKLRRK